MTVTELKSRPLWKNLYYRFPYIVKWKRHADPGFCEEKPDMVETDTVIEIRVDTSSNIIWITTCEFSQDFKTQVQNIGPRTIKEIIKASCNPIYSGLTAPEFVKRSFFASESGLRNPETYMKATVNPPKAIADSLVIFTVQVDDNWVIVYEDIDISKDILPPTFIENRKLRDFLCLESWKGLIQSLPNIEIQFWNGRTDKKDKIGIVSLDSIVHIVRISLIDHLCTIRTSEFADVIGSYELSDSLRLWLSKLGTFNGSGAGDPQWTYYICPESKFGNFDNWMSVTNRIPTEIMLRKVRFVITLDNKWVTIYDDTEDADLEYEKIYGHYLTHNIVDGDTYIIHPNQKVVE